MKGHAVSFMLALELNPTKLSCVVLSLYYY